MRPQTKNFKKNLSWHLSRKRVIQNISRAAQIAIGKRNRAAGELPNWEDLRQQAYETKKAVIADLWKNLEQFQKNAEASGVVVYRAATAEEANRLAEGIAIQHGVKRIVKSKSMLTEEIGFNDYMMERGFEVTETDLGEYIIQLAGETPSNLIGPAMHKSRQEVAELFARKLGIPYSDDPEFLTRTARDILRGKFISADMGVTGANFGIVENGAIVLVENEGNARMCITLPKVHVVFIGIEKLIPSMTDLAPFLTLLCRSGTGQKLTSYISVVHGPRQPQDFDGPEHVYYIIVDNGRSRFLEDEHLKEALYCIRCSACYNICPVYRNIGGHAYGWVYQGPIGEVITPGFLGLSETRDIPYASSLCGACSDICPVKIPLHHLILYRRHQVVENKLSPWWERLAFQFFTWMMSTPRRYELMGNLARLAAAVTGGKLPVPGWSKTRDFPPPASTPFRIWWEKEFANSGRKRGGNG